LQDKVSGEDMRIVMEELGQTLLAVFAGGKMILVFMELLEKVTAF